MTYRTENNGDSSDNGKASSVPCPEESALSGGCGRTPFLSDEECDRGSVDTSQFDDFPYCEPIDPIDPDIPPEIIEFPAPPPLPTFTCSCINIDYTFKLEYSDKFDTRTKFVSEGDCCDGMYDSEFDIEIKCPLPDAEAKVKVKLAWNDPQEGEAVVFRKKEEECELEVPEEEIEIGLPCPVLDNGEDSGKMKIKLGWDLPEEDTSEFAKVDAEKCEIEIENPSFEIGLPCPLVGNEIDMDSVFPNTIKLLDESLDWIEKGLGPRYIGYSISKNVKVDKERSDVISFGDVSIVRNLETGDVKVLGMKPGQKFVVRDKNGDHEVSAETVVNTLVKLGRLDAVTKCEEMDPPDGGFAMSVSWDGNKPFSEVSEQIIEIDKNKCELRTKSPCFPIDIPCPIPDDKSVKIKLDWKDKKQDEHKVIEKENDEFGCSINADPVEFDIGLPCPIPDEEKEVKISIEWGDGDSYDQQPVIKKDDNDCSIDTELTEFNLQLPCPIPDEEKEIKISIDWGDGDKYDQQAVIKKGQDDCSIDTKLTEFNLQLPCPIPDDEKELKISIDWGNGKKSDQQAIIKKGEDDCSIDTETTSFDLNLPCPIESFDSKLDVRHGWDSNKITRAILAEKGSNGCSIKVNSVDVDYGVPWPVVGDGTRSISIELRYEDGFMSDNHEFVDTSSRNHTMEFYSSAFKLAIPCPLDNLDVSVSRDESDSYDFEIEIENEEDSGKSGGKGGGGGDGRDCKKKLKVKQQLPSKHEVSVFTGVEFDCKNKKFIFKTQKIKGRFYMEEGEDVELEIPVSKHQRCPK